MNQRAQKATSSLVTILFILLLVSSSFAMHYPGITQDQPKPYKIPGLVTIQFEDDIDLNTNNKMQRSFGAVSFNLASLDNILSKHQVINARKIFPMTTERPETNSGMVDLTRYYELAFDENIDVDAVVEELSQNPNLRMAEAVWAQPLYASPNDPEWPGQWAMEPVGPDPNFYTAWDYETGSDSIKFAIVDSGILYNHRDLQGNIWVNPGEDLDGDGVVFDIDDENGIDDDGNGYVDDLVGYDFLTGIGSTFPGEDGGSPDNDPSDFGGHGTHVSGIVAAMNNNGLDVTGAAGGWYGGSRSFRGVQIICCRVGATASDGNGYVNPNNCATAIAYAIGEGVDVINASWGGSSASAAAAGNAVAAGVTFTHAAGNDDANTADAIDSKAGVISVASTGPNSDNKSSFSNWGNWVDVSAPGSSILSTYSDQYDPITATIGGTSMAAPMVAGLACLIRSQMPSLTKDQVDSLILETADSLALYSVNPLEIGNLGTGRIDALAALIDLANAKFTADVTEGDVPLTVNFTDLSPNSPIAWDWSFGTGDVSTDQNPTYVYNEPGLFDVSLIIDENNPLGPGEEHLRRYIWVRQDSLLGDSIETTFNSEVVVPIYLHNTSHLKEIKYVFSYANNSNITFDSVSVVGTRAEYFENVSLDALDLWNKRISVNLKTNTSSGTNYLVPGSGVLFNIHFSVGTGGLKEVTVIDTTTFNGKSSVLTSIYGEYFPTGYTPVKINVGGCCVGIRGNFDTDASDLIDISDLVAMVDFLFNAGPPSECVEEANVDGDAGGIIDISDLVYLVDFMFTSGPAPASCF